jgi:signal transduction histidine kinase
MREAGERITIIVEDNGIGMGPATLAKLFQPFYTEREGGSGIGTIIIKRVVEGHGGSIGVESTEGVGTTFTVTLPRG